MSVVINETTFPDSGFRTFVSREFDTNGDGVLSDSECLAVRSINAITDSTIYSLRGAEYFPNLEIIKIYHGAAICGLDFSKFPELKEIASSRSSSISVSTTEANYDLNFSENTSLQRVELHYLSPRYYTITNISFPPSIQEVILRGIECGSQRTVTLSFTNCVEIRSVVIENVHAYKLNVAGLSNKSQLTDVKIARLTSTPWISVSTPLGALELSHDERLQTIEIFAVDLSNGFSVSYLPNLNKLCIPSCQLTGTLDLSSFEQLTWIDVSNNSLSGLRLGTKSNLKYLFLGTSPEKRAIDAVDVTGCSRLMYYLEESSNVAIQYYTFSTNDKRRYYSPSGDFPPSYSGDVERIIYTASKMGAVSDSNYYNIAYRNATYIAISYIPSRTTLIYYSAPEIVTQPMDGLVSTGNRASFSVIIAKNTPDLSYQWQYARPSESSGELAWTDILHATSLSYSFTTIKSDNGLYYRCVLTNPAGTTFSDTARLTVLDPPRITTQPNLAEIVAVNSNATLSVVATGDELDYRWEYGDDSRNFSPITDADAANYQLLCIEENDNKYYRCVVFNRVASVATTPVQLHLAYQPAFESQPLSQAVQTGATVELSVSAIGGGLSYQWEYASSDGSEWFNLDGATANTYSFSAVRIQSGYRYRCIVSNIIGAATSMAAIVTVLDPPSITTQPALPKDVAEGTTRSLSVVAKGDSIVYQWQASNNGSTYTNINGATAPTYSITASRELSGRYFRCNISNSVGSVTSNSVNLHVVYQPVITKQPLSDTVQTGRTIVLSITATGDSLSYQWQASFDHASSWQDLIDITTASYSFTPVRADSGTNYRCVVTNAAGTATSDAATLTVLDAPYIIAQPALPNDVIGGSTAVLRVEATGDNLSYQWQVSTNGSIFEEIDRAWTDSYSVVATAATSGNRYRCYISNAVGSIMSAVATLHAVYQPEITKQPSSSTVQSGKSVSLRIEASGDSLSYQWQYSSNNGTNWINIAAGTSQIYSFTANRAQSGYMYRCTASNIVGTATSDAITLTILDAPSIITQPSLPEMVNSGSTNVITVDALGDSLSYQWQVSSNGTTYTNLSGATRSSYSVIASKDNAGSLFRCYISNDVGSATTNPVVLNLVFPPEITEEHFPDSVVQNGQSVTFSVDAIGGNLSYQWQVSIDNETSWTNLVDGVSSPAYSFLASVSQSGYAYRCIVTNPLGTVTSTSGVLNVLSPPAILSDPSSVVIGDGGAVAFTITASGSEISYQWQISLNYGSSWADIQDATSYTYAFTAVADKSDTQYRCRVSNDLASVVSGAAVLIVLTAPVIDTQPKDTTVSYAKTAVFRVSASGGNLSYQWQYRVSEADSWLNVEKNGASSLYSFVALDTENGYQYRCIVSNAAGSVYSDPATLTVTEYEEPEPDEQDEIHEGEYLPSQMAEAIRAYIPNPSKLDDVGFGNMPDETVYNFLTNPGFTDPILYEEISEALNEVKDWIEEIGRTDPQPYSDLWTGGSF